MKYDKSGCDGRPSGKPKDVLPDFTDKGSSSDAGAGEAFPKPPRMEQKNSHGVAGATTERSSSILSEGPVQIPSPSGSHSGRPS